MGTALLARGLDAGTAPEAWLARRAEEITAVHASHVASGAQMLLTCTFNLASRRLDHTSLEDVGTLAARAVAAARAAGPDGVAPPPIAGAVGPSGLWAPGGAPPPAGDVESLYARAFGALADAGADLLWAESQYVAGEARAALRCGLATGLPVAVSVVYATPRGPPLLPDGTPVADLLVELAGSGAAAVGLNCVLPDAAGVEDVLAFAAARAGVPIIAKPSPGLPGRVVTPAEFGALCARLAAAGASWIGGCCGATAAHVAEAARALHATAP